MKKTQLPVTKNEHYVMIIDDLGINGEGIGKIKGYTLFVDGALPREEIEVRVVKTKKNFGFGKLIKILTPSKDRQEPVCGVAKRCGGCQLQHISYQAQLDSKTKKVKDILERIGGLKDIEVKDTLGMEMPYNYRNKVQFPVGYQNDKLSIGFYASRTHEIIDTQKCYIQDEVNERITEIIKKFMIDYNISAYDEKKHKGLVKHILTRIGYHTKEIMICLIINGTKLPHEQELINRLKNIEGIRSIYININKEKNNVILGNQVKLLWGEKYITDYIGKLKFEISPLSFFQVNPIQTKKLYDKALQYAELSGNEIVWDAYCGIGTISLFLAQKAKKVYGVEIIEQAINDANKNAQINNIDNVEFFVGKAEEVIPEHYKKTGEKINVVVVDPPRKGCNEQLLDTIIEMKSERMVYVSCDPATLARDLKYLCENGEYRVEEVQPVDMFPMTTHVETVVKLVLV